MNKFTRTSKILSLFDTNILIFAHNPDSPLQGKAKDLLFAAINGDIDAVLAPQNLLEFYSVITSPNRVEKPLSLQDVHFLVREYLASNVFGFIYPQEGTVGRAFDLAARYDVRKAEIFDTFLVATMLDNEVRIIYTDNEKHFKMFKEIKTVNPFK